MVNSWILPSNKKKLIWISFMKRFNPINHCNFYINPSLILLWLVIIFKTTFKCVLKISKKCILSIRATSILETVYSEMLATKSLREQVTILTSPTSLLSSISTKIWRHMLKISIVMIFIFPVSERLNSESGSIIRRTLNDIRSLRSIGSIDTGYYGRATT